MNLVHFSKTKFVFDKERKYTNTFVSPNFKPQGLWVSNESADMNWSRWCRDNHFQEKNLKYRTELEVDLSKVLLLRSKRDMECFQLTYRTFPVEDSALVLLWPKETSFVAIDWGKVATEYKGIIITPYLWEFRHKSGYIWYYGWDCAGGCIWDLSCIKLVNT